jgi:hypothetical protein
LQISAGSKGNGTLCAGTLTVARGIFLMHLASTAVRSGDANAFYSQESHRT